MPTRERRLLHWIISSSGNLHRHTVCHTWPFFWGRRGLGAEQLPRPGWFLEGEVQLEGGDEPKPKKRKRRKEKEKGSRWSGEPAAHMSSIYIRVPCILSGDKRFHTLACCVAAVCPTAFARWGSVCVCVFMCVTGDRSSGPVSETDRTHHCHLAAALTGCQARHDRRK